MSNPPGSPGAPPTATFHVRVAKVGLITALVVLAAACMTFMLQQWAVARTQSHQMHQALADVAAASAPAPVLPRDDGATRAALAARASSKRVLAVRLSDAGGHTIASFDRGKAVAKDTTEVVSSA